MRRACQEVQLVVSHCWHSAFEDLVLTLQRYELHRGHGGLVTGAELRCQLVVECYMGFIWVLHCFYVIVKRFWVFFFPPFRVALYNMFDVPHCLG